MTFLQKVVVSIARDECLPCNGVVGGADTDRLNELSCFPFQSSAKVVEFLNVVDFGIRMDEGDEGVVEC